MTSAFDRLRLSSVSLSCIAVPILLLSLGFNPGGVWANDDAPAAEKKADAADEEKELPAPKELDLTTKDDLELKATYFPGTKGSDSIPVIIIHGLGPKCNRKEFTKWTEKEFTPGDGLARFLQSSFGCAVIVPDLRSHGDSTKWSDELQKKLRMQKKRPKEALKAEKLKPADRTAMLEQDLRAVKDYLWEKNNDGKLNLDKLTVIGVEEGAALAISYAAADAKGYEYGAAKYGPLKLGNFLKALVLVSPQANRIPGLNTARVLHDADFRDLRRDLSIMILAGDQNTTYFNEAKTLHSLFDSGRPKLDANSKYEDMTLWFFDKGKTPTTLQGAKLLSEPSLKMPEKIGKFIEYRLIKNPDAKEWVWKQRKLPHE